MPLFGYILIIVIVKKDLQKNRLVIVTMLLDVALNVLPSVFASVFAKVISRFKTIARTPIYKQFNSNNHVALPTK